MSLSKDHTLPCTLSWNNLKVVTDVEPEKIILGIKIPDRKQSKPPKVILDKGFN